MRYISFVLMLSMFFSCKKDMGGNTKEVVQEKFTIGDILTIQSEILNEDRNIYIYLPDSYTKSTFNYPVIYLLDAENDFHHTTGLVNFLATSDKIPEHIVVGIENTNRSRDLTPEAPNDIQSQQFWGEIGGAKSFSRFIDEELIPFINNNFRTNPYKIIRGQSFGGLFAFYDLLKGNQLFNAYLTSSPQISWSNNMLWNDFEKFKQLENNHVKVFIAEAEKDFKNEIKTYSDSINMHVNDSRTYRHKLYRNEDHYSLVNKATKDGLLFIYKYYPVNEIDNLNQLHGHFKRLSEELGYEIKIPMSAVIELANSQLRKQDYKEGVRIAKYNIELYPNQPQAYWHTADALSMGGHYADANDFYKKAYELAKNLNFDDVSDYKLSLDNNLTKIKTHE